MQPNMRAHTQQKKKRSTNGISFILFFFFFAFSVVWGLRLSVVDFRIFFFVSLSGLGAEHKAARRGQLK